MKEISKTYLRVWSKIWLNKAIEYYVSQWAIYNAVAYDKWTYEGATELGTNIFVTVSGTKNEIYFSFFSFPTKTDITNENNLKTNNKNNKMQTFKELEISKFMDKATNIANIEKADNWLTELQTKLNSAKDTLSNMFIIVRDKSNELFTAKSNMDIKAMKRIIAEYDEMNKYVWDYIKKTTLKDIAVLPKKEKVTMEDLFTK